MNILNIDLGFLLNYFKYNLMLFECSQLCSYPRCCSHVVQFFHINCISHSVPFYSNLYGKLGDNSASCLLIPVSLLMLEWKDVIVLNTSLKLKTTIQFATARWSIGSKYGQSQTSVCDLRKVFCFITKCMQALGITANTSF